MDIKYFVSWVTWPALMVICLAITAYGFALGHPVIAFNISYVFLIVALWRLEIFMPYAREWQKPDGQNLASIAHTLTSKGTVQGVLLFGGTIGLADYITPVSAPGYSLWPRDWPMTAQVILGLVTAEFGLYWGHRLAHETYILWRFHMIHHSVTKLWFVNTGRFHFVDSFKSIMMGLGVLLALGAPMEVVKWMSVITAFIGMLTHCNVEMRFGWLSYIFNTPTLHRWHHSKKIREGNKNYSENIMLWDLIFGTFFNPDRPPPVDIGIKEIMPTRFGVQLIWPFLPVALKRKFEPDYVPLPFVRKL